VRGTREKTAGRARGARRQVSETIPPGAAGTVAARRYLDTASASSTALSGQTKKVLISYLAPKFKGARSNASDVRDQALIFAQSIKATAFARDLNDWLGKLLEGPATIYDKAMDANYVTTHIGGSLHRLFDGAIHP
jgi:hypothetical protein